MPITVGPSSFPYLAENLRLLRLAQRLTQQQLVGRLGSGFTQSYLSRLENGLRPADPQHVDLLAQALGVSASTLLARPIRPQRLQPRFVAADTGTPGCGATQGRA